jgi:hypothetical protein
MDLLIVKDLLSIESTETDPRFNFKKRSFLNLENIPKEAKSKTGSVRIKGKLDQMEIAQKSLWTNGSRGMMLLLNEDILKKLNKNIGDKIAVEIYADLEPVFIPEEFKEILEEYPLAKAFFEKINETNKANYLKFIYTSPKIEIQTQRIISTIDRLERGLKYYDTDPKNQTE